MRNPLWFVSMRDARFVRFVWRNSETEKPSWRRQMSSNGNNASCFVHPRVSLVRVSRTYTLLRTIFHIRGSTAGQRIVHFVAGCGRACAREFHFRTTDVLGSLNVYRSTKIARRRGTLYWPNLHRDLILRLYDNALGQNWLDRHWEICVHWRGFCMLYNDLNIGVDVVTFTATEMKGVALA